ncbi:Regulation of nuclear pre-mRNA domain-containing protein 2 [Takifugu flavidus]|uniref:Regulation of nuclear pre-mRNA domain-containing protein 2 n=1 Tax=Takifugu flavidus TaxID=433684 RepID=A0A5C6PJK6_9TELE|nr:Regulation of nuclear pre-mRNA domain-containing protein 2 [Takifugu flavidus]
MAAGSGAASAHGARSSSAALEASLDRRFQGVSNTMESIQGLSTWCIENKKHHGLIVRSWMKWLKKSDNNHRLNLFYLANDVIQNCKRKNAVIFRSAFADVLPNAAQFIRDGKVRKSVERIFTIWEERSVYPEEVIAQFKAGMNKKEKEKPKEKVKEATAAKAPGNTKAALKNKIVAEFTPQSLLEQLTRYKQTAAEEELREKQLGALRVDLCSPEALKRLKDKAEGNKFAKDFEENSQKLQEFVGFLEKELKSGPPLIDALGNADIFYEMQYKEVKIVANAYNAFANRVASLKRKLDSLKSTLPGPEDSPIPSPSEDAPSPTGSDSPFLVLGPSRAQVDPELDGKAMDDGDGPIDNRDTEDMDMSEEEADVAAAEDDKKEKNSSAGEKTAKPGTASKPPSTPTKPAKSNPAPSAPGGVNLEKVDLGKISSILNSLTCAMKNTASPAQPPTGATTSSGPSASAKAAPSSPALASILSRVDITPEGILNALSKANTPGLSSLLQNVTNASAPHARSSPESSGVKVLLSPTNPKARPALVNNSSSFSPPSLESKINSFLQGNPNFGLTLGDDSPDGVDGTPVRDEAAGTPTQDEIMDTPGSLPESRGASLSPTAYRNDPWDAVITPSESNSNGEFAGSSSRYAAGNKSGSKLKDESATHVKKHVPSSPGADMKGRKDGQHNLLGMVGVGSRAGEKRAFVGARKASDDGGQREKAGERRKEAAGEEDGRYHRIETLVSPCTEGAPIQTLGYSNRPRSPESESRQSRAFAGGIHGSSASFPPRSPASSGHQPGRPKGQRAPDAPTSAHPPSTPPPSPAPSTPPGHFQMPYHTEGMPPSLLLQHPPTSPCFGTPPPIPRPPPPPMSQLPPPTHPAVPSAVMVGGVLVPVDHPSSLPHPMRPDAMDRGGVGHRGGKAGPLPLMSSLLGEPPKMPRPGTVKEHYMPRHAAPLHRPGAPAVPLPLLGRVKEPLQPPLVPPSPTSSTTSPSTPNSPAVDAISSRLTAPPLLNPPTSPPSQPHNQASGPVPLLDLPSRPPILSLPMSQRPMLRGRPPSQQHNRDHPRGGMRGGKRSGPPFAGGPFPSHKRPYLPPRY